MLPLNTSTASSWGGAGNRTLALTSTASRAATDTSATVLLVWVLGFEPRASSVRGRHSGRAELHPVTEVWSSVPDSNRDHSLIGRRSYRLDEPTVISRFPSASRLSFSSSLPGGRGRDQASLSSSRGAPRIRWRGWQGSHLRASVLETAPPLWAHPRVSGPACLAPRPGFEPGTAGLTVRLPYPPGPRGIRKAPLFRTGLHRKQGCIQLLSDGVLPIAVVHGRAKRPRVGAQIGKQARRMRLWLRPEI